LKGLSGGGSWGGGGGRIIKYVAKEDGEIGG